MNAFVRKAGCQVLFAAALSAVGIVRAEGQTWYFVGPEESTSSYGALWTASKWNSSESGDGSPATAFRTADTYVTKKQVVAAGTRTFAGGPLVAKSTFWTVGAGSIAFPYGLEIAAGGWRNRYGKFDVYGSVTITYVDTYPYVFYCDNNSVTTFHGPLIGASNVRINCGENNAAGEGSTFVFAGDNSGYSGSANVKPAGTKSTKAGFASFPGKMAVQNNAVLLVGVAGANTVSTYKTFEIANGATLELLATKEGDVFSYPSLAATDSLTVGETVAITIPQAALPGDGMPHAFDVLTAPEGGSVSKENFTLKTTDGAALSSDYLAVSEDGRTLRIVFPAVIPSGVTFLTGETPTSGVMELVDLTFEAGAILKLNGAWSGTGDSMTYSSASVSVSSSLTVNAPVTVSATRYAVPADGKEHTIDILKAPVGVTIDPDDFVFERTEDGVQLATLGVRQDGGRDVLSVTFEPVVEMVVSDKAGTGKAADTTSDTAWYTPASWSDNQTPHDGAHYLVRQATSSSTPWFLRTPTHNIFLTFPGDSLTLERNVWLVIFQGAGNGLTVADLRLRDGASVLYGQSCYGSVRGKITMEGGAVNFGSYGNSITIAADICGSGRILASGPKDYGSNAFGGITLSGDNSAFTGTINVEYCRNNPDATQKYIGFYVSASKNLGGNLAAFDPAGLRIAKYDRFVVDGDATIAAESMRGMTVDGLGNDIEVRAGKTFTLGTQLTLNSPLDKVGPGTFVLGGAAVADGAAFTVSEGKVVVAGADALNGVETILAAGTSLALAVDPDNEALCRDGIRNVKTDTPFTLASGTQLPFSLVVSDAARAKLKAGAKSIGLFTVTANAAPAMRTMLAGLVFRVPGLTLTPFESTDQETGDVTFGLESVPSGLAIILR